MTRSRRDLGVCLPQERRRLLQHGFDHPGPEEMPTALSASTQRSRRSTRSRNQLSLWNGDITSIATIDDTEYVIHAIISASILCMRSYLYIPSGTRPRTVYSKPRAAHTSRKWPSHRANTDISFTKFTAREDLKSSVHENDPRLYLLGFAPTVWGLMHGRGWS